MELLGYDTPISLFFHKMKKIYIKFKCERNLRKRTLNEVYFREKINSNSFPAPFKTVKSEFVFTYTFFLIEFNGFHLENLLKHT